MVRKLSGSALVADSSPYTTNLVAAMLRNLGFADIREAHDSRLASAILDLQDFDVLLLDDRLAGRDGVALTRWLRTREGGRNRRVAVLMMSGQPDGGKLASARDAGITEFLRKPFSAAQLEQRLAAMRAQPRPFVEAPAYAGPDRRRRGDAPTGVERRGT